MSKKIMILDDELDFGQTLSNLFDAAGFTSQYFESPIKAIESLRSEHWDIVITDVIMPKMDGLEFIKTLQAENIFSGDIYVISAFTDYQPDEFLKRGAKGVFRKPEDVRAMVSTIANFKI